MELACLDLEGVLVPEIWIEFAERTGGAVPIIAVGGVSTPEQAKEMLEKNHD